MPGTAWIKPRLAAGRVARTSHEAPTSPRDRARRVMRPGGDRFECQRCVCRGRCAWLEQCACRGRCPWRERFITRYGLGETRAAIELLFTLPGIPLIYDGDEVGAAFRPYDEGPLITWRDAHGLTPLYARMAGERRSVHALTSPGLKIGGHRS